MLKYLLFFLINIFFAYPSFALEYRQKTDHVQLTLIPEYQTLSANTSEMTIISAVDIEPNWHIYWQNPGDTGDPTILSFYDSPHYQISAEQQSFPQKALYNDMIITYVHRHKLFYKTTFKLNQLESLSHLSYKVVLSYTICQKECLPETISLKFSLPIKDAASPNPTYIPSLLNAENTFPLPLDTKLTQQHNLLELEIAESILKNCPSPEFVSNYIKKNILSDLPQTTLKADNKLQISFAKNEIPQDMSGILLCENHAYQIKPLATTPPSSSLPAPHLWHNSLLYYLLTAFLAGLILNLMPCVLPILSLKALHLAAHKEKASVLSALLYLSGVLVSFIILAGILFYLRSFGTELGWGFQLQSPVFNALLFILFFLIFLNLTDKLSLPNSFADKLDKIADGQSFLTGFFAVIIACPCTGPFMGAALGYAITKPAVIYFSIFLCLGFGYALPYVLIEFFPAFFLKFIPKPGPWMQTLKRILSVPIALTCLWLFWITAHQLAPSSQPTEINWETYSPQAVAQALDNKEAVFVDFTAKWCLICLLNDKTTLATADFKELAQKHHIRLFKADWTSRNQEIGDALKTYGRNSIPLYIYYKKGEKQPQYLPQILTTDILKQALK